MTEIFDLVYGLRIEVPWWAWVALVVMVFGGLLIPDHSDGCAPGGLTPPSTPPPASRPGPGT